MSSIFDFIKEGKEESSFIPSSNYSIFEAAKNMPEVKEPTRVESITAAPIKGIIKGASELAQGYQILRDPIAAFLGLTGHVVTPELGEKVTEQVLPTQKKAPERFLERAGKVSTYVAGRGNIIPKIIRGGIATLGGQLAEEFGLPKSAQGAIEIAGLLSPTRLNGAQKFASSLYSEADTLSQGGRIPARNLVTNIQNFIAKLSRGGPAVSKNAALNQANAIFPKIRRGNIEIKELTEFKKTINEARSSLYLDQNLDKVGKRTAKRNLDEMSKIIDSALDEYGRRNPQWAKTYRAANEAHGAIANSQKVRNWIGNIIKQHPHATGSALAGALIGHALVPKALIGTVAGGVALKSGEFIARIMKSPVLRQYYQRAIQEAIKENPNGFLNYMAKLEKSLKSEKETD